MPVNPYLVPVPAIPGPILTNTTSAFKTSFAVIKAVYIFIHSPNALPIVIVLSINPFFFSVSTFLLKYIGRAAPSVIMYTNFFFGFNLLYDATKEVNILCKLPTTTGILSKLENSSIFL